MRKTQSWRLLFVTALLLLCGAFAFSTVSGQESESKPDKDAESDAPVRDGHDRPTSYPKISFGGKKDDAKEEADDTEEKPEPKVDLKTRVYLLDTSEGMSKSITIDGVRESTRLQHMVTQMGRSLDALKKRKDPRLRFNIITYGTVKDFANGKDLQAVTVDTTDRARKWLGELKSAGDASIYPMLKECFEQAPDTATMIVGAEPAWSDDVKADEREKYDDAGAHLLAKVNEWRRDGKTTTLDITGVGLSKEEAKYFKKLAEAAGGTYLDA